MSIIDKRTEVLAHNGAVAAGSGVISQATYTIPTGYRARLKFIHSLINTNAAAAGVVSTNVFLTLAGVNAFISQLYGTGAAAVGGYTFQQEYDILLNEGDVITIQTANTSAVNASMRTYVLYEEFQ